MSEQHETAVSGAETEQETKQPEVTEKKEPEAAEGEKPEAAQTAEAEAAEEKKPEAVQTAGPEAADAGKPEAAKAEEPETVQAEEPVKERRRMSGLHKGIIAAAVAAALAGAYLGMSLWYSHHFMPHSILNGNDVSGMSEDQVEQKLLTDSAGYVLAISGRNSLTDSIAASDISLQPVFDGSIGKLIRSQNVFSWPVSLFRTSDYTISSVADFSEDELQAKIDSLAFFNAPAIVKPTDASYAFQNGRFEIIPETEGSEPDREKTHDAIVSALSGFLPTLSMDEAGCYTEPQVRSDNAQLQKEVSELNTYAAVSLTFRFGDSTEVLDGSTVKDWISLNGTTVSVDAEKVENYVKGLSEKYDTFGHDRQFTTHSGETITVYGGDYGWWMDQDSTAAEITDALQNGKSGELEPVWFGKGAAFGADDIGNSYVEVDLNDQHVWVYQEGSEVVSTDCVSGKAAIGHGTPTGTYAVTFKQKDATLVGEGYSSPVSYWMPFNRNVGMHDATWRSSFGGKIYVNSGSHGCVNLPYSAAKQIFASIEKGEAVVVYGGMSQADAVAYDHEQGLRVPVEAAPASAASGTASASDTSSALAAAQAAAAQAAAAAQQAQAAAVQAAAASQADPSNAALAAAAQQAQAASDTAVANAQQLTGQAAALAQH